LQLILKQKVFTKVITMPRSLLGVEEPGGSLRAMGELQMLKVRLEEVA
jgi:hypothetical protein